MKIRLSELKKIIRNTLKECECEDDAKNEGEGSSLGGDASYMGPGYFGSQEDETASDDEIYV